MTDDLHAAELLQWAKRVQHVPENSVLMVGDASDLFPPSALGLCTPSVRKSNVAVLKQFKALHGLTDTVLMPCKDVNHASVQPCYCACAAYRERAHIEMSCDICGCVPVGSMYTCAECDDIVHSLCEQCYGEYDHGCGEMARFSKPMNEKVLRQHVDRWRRVRKVREPCNTKKRFPLVPCLVVFSTLVLLIAAYLAK
jgi:hypothetical protein